MSATRASGPPRLAEWLIARRLRRDDQPMILGDLQEQFRAHVRASGVAFATRWYWREVARLAWGLWWWSPGPARPWGTLMTLDDLRYAVRRLSKRPVAAVISVMTLGCAIGAAAATWSLMSAVLLHPLQFPDPEHLVQVAHREDWPGGSQTMTGYNYPTYAALRNAGLMPMAASGSIGSSTPLLVQGAGQAREGSIIFASHDLLKLLGLHVSLGRFFGEREDQRGAPLVAVLSDRFWRSEFNADPRVIGRLIRVRDRPVTVVGVAPVGFHGFEVGRVPDLFMPLNAMDQVEPYPGLYGDRPPLYWIEVVGRLPEGVTSTEMAARLNGLNVGLPAGNKGFVLTGVETAALSEQSRADVRQFSRLLGTTVAMLLAVGSITVGMLLLLRTEARSGELAMCLALGASRARLAAGIAVEGMVLAAAGAALGLPVSRMLFAGIRAFELPGNIRVDRLDLSIDARVLAGAAAAAVASVLLMAAVASLFGVRRDLGDVLRSHAGVTPRLTRRRSRSALVTAQVAVTLVLVTGAGLFARSVVRALSLNPGVDTHRLFETRLDLNGYGYDRPRAAAFLEALQQRLAFQPAIGSLSVWDAPESTRDVRVDGHSRTLPPLRPGAWIGISEEWIDNRYLSTIGVPISAGRSFTTTDRAGAPSVAIVNASLAKLIAGDGNPIGHRIDLAGSVAVSAEVVGVVPDVMVVPGALKPLRLYMPFAQQPALPIYPGSGAQALLVRATGDVPAAIAAVTAVVRDLDPQMHLRPMSSFDDVILDEMAAQRFGMTVMGALGAIALLLSVVGIYVLVESMGTLRRREIGIRASLGARSDQLRMVLLSETFRLVGAGLLLGFVFAWLGAGTIRAFLFEVEPFDPLVTGSVAALIAALAILVSLRPVWAAARVDLVRVLRED